MPTSGGDLVACGRRAVEVLTVVRPVLHRMLIAVGTRAQNSQSCGGDDLCMAGTKINVDDDDDVSARTSVLLTVVMMRTVVCSV